MKLSIANQGHSDCRPEHIDAFLHGELSSAALAEFEQHLNVCPDCDTELTDRTAEPSFWTDAKTFLSSAIDRDLNQDRNQLSFLDPTDDPNMLGRFGGYEISGVIGSGGMGIVMKGWDVSLDRFVAIKVLNAAYTGQSASRKRFAREAQAAAAVLHDNVIAIYGVDQWKGMPYLVMPYIKGESLQRRIDRTAPLALEDILGISLQIARGLAAAHDQGLVHRDIKPANILMPASVSRVIITDFGLARTADDASLTRSGVLAGTPQYMSPEQAKGVVIDARADLFSLGSVIYAMACGHPPFRAETPYGVLRKITDEAHRPLSSVREDAPAWFTKIVDRLLQKDPQLRFQTANELAEHLEDCLAHLRQPTTTTLPKLQTTTTPNTRLRRFAIAVTAGTAIVVLIVAALMTTLPSTNQNETTQLDQPDQVDAETSTPSAADTPTDFETLGQRPPHLEWEFDASQLDDLETELRLLNDETGADLSTDSPTISE